MTDRETTKPQEFAESEAREIVRALCARGVKDVFEQHWYQRGRDLLGMAPNPTDAILSTLGSQAEADVPGWAAVRDAIMWGQTEPVLRNLNAMHVLKVALATLPASPIRREGDEQLGGQEVWDALVDAARGYADFVAAREEMNAAIPAIGATSAERALYDERYKADHLAEREHHRTAIKLAQHAEQLVADILEPCPLASAPKASDGESGRGR